MDFSTVDAALFGAASTLVTTLATVRWRFLRIQRRLTALERTQALTLKLVAMMAEQQGIAPDMLRMVTAHLQETQAA